MHDEEDKPTYLSLQKFQNGSKDGLKYFYFTEKRKKIMCTHVFWPPPTSFKTSVTRRPPFQNSTSTMSSTSDLSATDVSLKNGKYFSFQTSKNIDSNYF